MSLEVMAVVLLPEIILLQTEIQTLVLVVILTGSKMETLRYITAFLAS